MNLFNSKINSNRPSIFLERVGDFCLRPYRQLFNGKIYTIVGKEVTSINLEKQETGFIKTLVKVILLLPACLIGGIIKTLSYFLSGNLRRNYKIILTLSSNTSTNAPLLDDGSSNSSYFSSISIKSSDRLPTQIEKLRAQVNFLRLCIHLPDSIIDESLKAKALKLINEDDSTVNLSDSHKLQALHKELETSFNQHIKQVRKLRTLDLKGLHFTVCPRELQEFSGLQHLDLSNNCLTKVPKILIKLSQLESLDLSHNQIDHISKTLFSLPKLLTLDLSDNFIITYETIRFPTLESIHLEKNLLRISDIKFITLLLAKSHTSKPVVAS